MVMFILLTSNATTSIAMKMMRSIAERSERGEEWGNERSGEHMVVIYIVMLDLRYTFVTTLFFKSHLTSSKPAVQ